MQLRIAHITATFPPYHGGTGNVCFHNARELVRRGHQVQVWTAAAPGAPVQEVIDGVHIQRLRPLIRVGNAPLLPGLFHRLRGFDIIHLHYPFFGGELTTLAAAASRTPLVITYHQDVLLSGLRAGIEYLLRHTVGWLTLRAASRVLFTSADYGRSSHIRRLLRGREQLIDELPNGVDLDHFHPQRDPHTLRHQLQLGDAEQVILLVAGLDQAHSFKGVDILLPALAQLPEQVRCIIVGDGDRRFAYAALAESLGLAQRVHFAGRVADELLPFYYRLADVTVLPSTTLGEAFGLVLLESLASGTPVIASNLPGVRTVVAPGDDGLLVEPGNVAALAAALRGLLADPARRAAMGQRGRTKVERDYGWAQIGQTLERIYLELVDPELRASTPARRGQA